MLVGTLNGLLQKDELKAPKLVIIVSNLIAIIAAATAVIVTYLGVFPFGSPLGLYPILPGDILVDFIWIWVLTLIFGGFIYLSLPVLVHLYFKLHQILTGGTNEYHIQIIETGDHRPNHVGRLVIPALVCLGLSFSITKIPDVVNMLFVMDSFDDLPVPVAEPLLASMPLFFVLLLLACFISILFAPAWFLEDLGVICVHKSDWGTTNVMGVGGWYLTLLKGFAGISTILAYVFVSVDMITWFQSLPSFGVEVPIWLFLIPVVVVVLSPLLAIAPISIAYIFYLRLYSNKSSTYENKLKESGLKRVSIEINANE